MKKLAMIPMTLALIPSFAQAFPQAAFGNAYNQVGAHSQDTSCANFSGKWKGTCTVNGQSSEETTAIRQKGCNIIRIDNDVLLVGGITTEQSTSPIVVQGQEKTFTMNRTSSADWNAAKTELNIQYQTQFRYIGMAIPTSTANLVGKLSFEDGKVVVQFAGEGQKLRCSYEKQGQ